MKSYVLENEQLSVCIVPEHGGKSVSIYDKERQFELLAQKEERMLQKPEASQSFVESAAYGFDDAFPSIEEGKVDINGSIHYYPDHGEIWSANMEVQQWSQDKQELILSYKGKVIPYTYQKKISLHKYSVCYSYTITNVGNNYFPCLWTCHCLVRYEEDMKILFPHKSHMFVNVLDSKELGKKGTEYITHNINKELDCKDTAYRFDRVPPADTGSMEKYYIKETIKQGRCGYEYPSQGVRCLISYDAMKLPYLGFFVTAGGLKGDYNCALEPCDGYYDSIETALKNKKCVILQPGEQRNFTLEIKLEGLS